ncbi:MAG: DUF4157 domain-containing protein [Oscillibacter sp.]|nr:DUF4157 domain-containing protein [Oscillibacter sp.]
MRKYASKKSGARPTAAQTAAQAVADNPGMPMSAMRAMLMDKAMADRSHRIDLPEAMREKMERAFGMNFGKVNLYESESVADAGANAIARGGNIAFAPGKDDFNSLDGQRRLGHELSHVAAQARGEVAGSGFLDNGALEARADREGAMAAAGERVYDGPMTDAPSFAGVSAPMQADLTEEEKDDWKKKAQEGPDIDDYIDRMIHVKNAMRYNERIKERRANGGRNEGKKLGDELEIRDEDIKMYQRMIANTTPTLAGRISARRDKAGKQFLDDYYFKGRGATDDMDENNEFRNRFRITDFAANSETFHNYSTMGQILDEILDYHDIKKPPVEDKTTKRLQTLEDLVEDYGKGLGMIAYGWDGDSIQFEDKAAEHSGAKIHNANIQYRKGAEGYKKYREGMDYIAKSGSKAWDMPALTKKERKYDPNYKKKREEKKKIITFDDLLAIAGSGSDGKQKSVEQKPEPAKQKQKQTKTKKKKEEELQRNSSVSNDNKPTIKVKPKKKKRKASVEPVKAEPEAVEPEEVKPKKKKRKASVDVKHKKKETNPIQVPVKPVEESDDNSDFNARYEKIMDSGIIPRHGKVRFTAPPKTEGQTDSGDESKQGNVKIKYDKHGLPENYGNGERITKKQKAILMDLLGGSK